MPCSRFATSWSAKPGWGASHKNSSSETDGGDDAEKPQGASRRRRLIHLFPRGREGHAAVGLRAHRARQARAQRAALAAERTARELARMRDEHAALRLDLALIRLQRVLARKYRPDQPRVPRGEDGAGRFADEGGGGGGGSGRVRLAQGDRLQGYAVDLREEEARGGHTIREHVAKSENYLLNRVREWQVSATRKGDLAEGLAAGSFTSLDSATRLVNSTLAQNRTIVDQVASGALPATRVDAQFGSETGYQAYAPTERAQPYMRKTFGVGVVIRHDRRSERGFGIISAFPRNINR